MHIINLTKLSNGAHQNNNSDCITNVPEGWAMIPDGFQLPSTFPLLGSLEAEEMTYTREVLMQCDNMDAVMVTREYTMMTVTKMTEYA